MFLWRRRKEVPKVEVSRVILGIVILRNASQLADTQEPALIGSVFSTFIDAVADFTENHGGSVVDVRAATVLIAWSESAPELRSAPLSMGSELLTAVQAKLGGVCGQGSGAAEVFAAFALGTCVTKWQGDEIIDLVGTLVGRVKLIAKACGAAANGSLLCDESMIDGAQSLDDLISLGSGIYRVVR